MSLRFGWYQSLTAPSPLDEFDSYDDYWTKRTASGDLPPLMPRYQLIAAEIPDGSTVLDIGCGDGSFLRYLQSTKPHCRTVGADISSIMINKLTTQGFEGKLISSDRPLQEQFDEYFDYVVMMEVIEHVHDAEGLTRQAARLARKRLYISIPNVGFVLHRLRLALCGRFPVTNVRCHMKEHIRFWTVKDFSEWIHHLGFTLIAVSPQVGSNEPWLIRLLAKTWPALMSKSVIYEVDPGYSD